MIYGAEFWRRAYELVDQHPHECEKCGVKNGTPTYRGTKESGRALVRLVLRDGDKRNINPENLGMGCTRCFSFSARQYLQRGRATAEQATIPK